MTIQDSRWQEHPVLQGLSGLPKVRALCHQWRRERHHGQGAEGLRLRTIRNCRRLLIWERTLAKNEIVREKYILWRFSAQISRFLIIICTFAAHYEAKATDDTDVDGPLCRMPDGSAELAKQGWRFSRNTLASNGVNRHGSASATFSTSQSSSRASMRARM